MKIGGAALVASASVGGYVAHVATRSPIFLHGVASTDPTSRSVLLWTRLTVEDEDSVEVEWVVATDVDLSEIVSEGTFTTSAARDFTVRVEATELSPGTRYHYGFRANGQRSPVGRTKTLPEGPVASFKIAFFCCSSFAHGTFHPYAKVAEDPSIDLVVHLGDYIYEFASGVYGRARKYDPPHACVSLDDYRRRHRQYKADPTLAEAHRLFPWVVLWDDHDFANNAFPGGAEGHREEHGDWGARREAARQAFMEYVPVRADEPGPIARTFALGQLADLIVADARMGDKTPPSRRRARDTMLGAAQEQWLEAALSASHGTYCVLAQQLIVASFKVTGRAYDQSWQAYPRSRARLLDQIERFAHGRAIAVSGDIHASVASVIQPDARPKAEGDTPTDLRPAMVEFVTPSVTSPCPFEDIPHDQNGHLAYLNSKQRGFLLLELTPEQAVATFHQVEPSRGRNQPPNWIIGRQFSVKPGLIALDDLAPDEVAEASSPEEDAGVPEELDMSPDEEMESEELESNEVTPG